MLRRSNIDKPVHTYGYLVAVEIEEGGATSPDTAGLRIADSLTFMEDVGKVDVTDLGRIECLNPTEEGVNTLNERK